MKAAEKGSGTNSGCIRKRVVVSARTRSRTVWGFLAILALRQVRGVSFYLRSSSQKRVLGASLGVGIHVQDIIDST